MKYSHEDLFWPHSKPSEIYLHLAEGSDGKKELSQAQAFQGHAVLRMCEQYDLKSSSGMISNVSQKPYQIAPIGACGFTLEDEDHSLIFHQHFASKLEGALEVAMIRLFPEHAGLLDMTRLDSQGGVLRSGMSANAAVEHPFFQGLVGLRSEKEAAESRLRLREIAIEAAGLPPMGPTTRARIWDWLKRESRTKHGDFDSFWKWASGFLHPDIVEGGMQYLRHAVFFHKEDCAAGTISGAAARRLRFLKFFRGAEKLFTPLRPENKEMLFLRDMVQQTSPNEHPRALYSRDEIEDKGREKLGKAAWQSFQSDPSGFIEDRL